MWPLTYTALYGHVDYGMSFRGAGGDEKSSKLLEMT